MKLSEFDTKTLSNKGVDVELKSLRDNSKTGAFITVLGTDSDAFKDIQIERAREALDRETRGLPQLTAEERDEQGIKTLARCTVGWNGIDGLGEFSQAAAIELYRNYPAIREQVNVAIADRRNFLLG